MRIVPLTNAYHLLTPRRMLIASIAVALLTIGLKAAAWHVTGSVGLLSDALEGLVNLAGAAFGLMMVTIAARPADAGHPYGHHKAEYFSSGFEGVLIIAAAAGIVAAAVQRLLHPQPLERIDWGLGLSAASAALNGLLAWVMFGAADAHRSIALQAGARHLVTDVWTSAGVVMGLLLVVATGASWIDPLIGLALAANIAREGVRLVWRSSQGLLDESLDAEDLATIEATLEGFRLRRGQAEIVRFDHLVSRQAAQRRFLDLHMHLPASWSLGRAASVRANVEQALIAALPGLRVSIQLLPSNVEAQADQIDVPAAPPAPPRDET